MHRNAKLTHTHTDGLRFLCVRQFILPQVVPDWIWSESYYTSPWLTLSCPHQYPLEPTFTHAYMHTGIHTDGNSLMKTWVGSLRDSSHTSTQIYWSSVTLSRWDHFYWLRQKGSLWSILSALSAVSLEQSLSAKISDGLCFALRQTTKQKGLLV